MISELQKNGEIFSNLTSFFEDRRMSSRNDNIALRLKSNFTIDSSEWKLWTNKTSVYNSTSLTQVFGEYFRDFSVGDNGGINVADSDYVSKPGYPGTLAPGEKFIQDANIDDLPRRVLHPWPAMQEILFHVRNPPSHPMIPPALLWFALNDMYTQNFTEWQLNLPNSEVVGGWMMEPKDAIRIAKFSKFGTSYNPDHQIPHGGLIFEGGIGGVVPHYNPDHGPTVSEQEAKTPIPPELIKITERWLDPYYNLDMELTNSVLSAKEKEEVIFEEEIRKIAAMKILDFYKPIEVPTEVMDNPESLDLSDFEVTNPVGKTAVESTAPAKRLADSTAIYFDKVRELSSAELDAFSVLEDEDGEMEMIRAEEIQEREIVVQTTIEVLDAVANGKTRNKKALIGYAIETIRDMQTEISRAERDLATKRRAGRRKQRKGASDAEIGSIAADVADAPLVANADIA